METPGNQCFVTDCRQLDFLPYRCNACKRTFCQEHRHYDAHQCPDAHAKDAKAPPCPVCGAIVPVPAGRDPNAIVEEHISRGCPPPSAASAVPAFATCGVRGCRKREAAPVTCPRCRGSFCMRHRFETDHDCKAARPAAPSPTRGRQPQGVQLPPGITEDEALAMAIQRSLEEEASRSSRPASRQQPPPPQRSAQGENGCVVS